MIIYYNRHLRHIVGFNFLEQFHHHLFTPHYHHQLYILYMLNTKTFKRQMSNVVPIQVLCVYSSVFMRDVCFVLLYLPKVLGYLYIWCTQLEQLFECSEKFSAETKNNVPNYTSFDIIIICK